MNFAQHRITHILNRNINQKFKYPKSEIYEAFQQSDYSKASQRQKLIYSKFFKECDEEDLYKLITVYHTTFENLKSIYNTSIYRNHNAISTNWDKVFNLPSLPKTPPPPLYKKDMSPVLIRIFKNKGVNYEDIPDIIK